MKLKRPSSTPDHSPGNHHTPDFKRPLHRDRGHLRFDQKFSARCDSSGLPAEKHLSVCLTLLEHDMDYPNGFVQYTTRHQNSRRRRNALLSFHTSRRIVTRNYRQIPYCAGILVKMALVC
ncbi:hypothetical protein HYFRA_00007094 [Hymenoscyphus fraxineus]|uniref:Uncharacterized protein n=1 Tax=Hymenoscyphus fraxineus TaxID=746836 RepID=A0A9N9KZQ8_9HELO|nr:hypothetical protein HYFRA_00007094 [Hymenoscyphus fraxineus]